MREVAIPQEDWPSHLGLEKAEQLLLKVRAGHKVEVKIYASCDICPSCVMCNLGLRSVIGGGNDSGVQERVGNRSTGQDSGTE